MAHSTGFPCCSLCYVHPCCEYLRRTSVRVGAQYHHCRVAAWLHWVVLCGSGDTLQIVILLCFYMQYFCIMHFRLQLAIVLNFHIFSLFFAALNEMGFRVSPQFIQLIVNRYDTQAKRALKFDDFIQVCAMIRTLTEAFRAKDTSMSGQITISYEDFMCMVLLNKP